MPLLPAVVVVHVAPPQAAQEHGQRLVTACTQGLRQGACVLAGGTQSESSTAIIAQVQWQDDGFRVVSVRVGRPGAQEREWVSGTVVFDDHDALTDRWTTTGFTIATLVGDLAPGQEQPEEPPEPARPSPSKIEPAPKQPPPAKRPAAMPTTSGQAQRRLQVSAGAALGHAMSDALRAGPWAALSFAPTPFPLAVRLRGAMSFSEEQNVAMRWSTLSAGLELKLPLGKTGVAAFGAVEGGATVLSASADGSDDLSGQLSILLGAELPISGPVRLLAGGELSLTRATDVRTETGEISDHVAKLAAFMGLGWEL